MDACRVTQEKSLENKMKIGILTQPLVNNYGGLLQAWALQQTFSNLGHQAIIVDRHSIRRKDLIWLRRIASILKTKLYILLGREKRRINLSEDQTNHIRKNIIPFIESRYLGVSPQIYTNKALRQYVESENFDAFVVGSDQVWRPCYSPSIGNYFLDFLSPESSGKRIAYAASFGVDYWEYTESQTKKLSELAKRFDLITVRESSGVKLVKDYLNSVATHVLDPTMLLEKEDYLSLIDEPTVGLHNSDGKLFCYVLDQNAKLQNIIKRVEKEANIKAYYCNAQRNAITKEDIEHLDECIFPPVEQWLKSFWDAEMVVTDSFHGTVFSIIFNKPFWVVANEGRGAARFTSLLRLFGLEDRLVSTAGKVNWEEPIDWGRVNAVRLQRATESLELLNTALK